MIDHDLGFYIDAPRVDLKGKIKRKGRRKHETFTMTANVKDREKGVIEIDIDLLNLRQGDYCIIQSVVEIPAGGLVNCGDGIPHRCL